MWDYEYFITEKLNIIKNTNEYDINIEIASEQAFAKLKTFNPNTIYVIIKKLASTLTYNITTQPVQILAITEQNQLDITKSLLEEFVNTYNWNASLSDETYVKQQYSSPVVLSNFNEVSYGYRSVIYVAGTLYLMEDVVDIDSLTIDGVEYKPLTFSVAYQMTGNTQAVGTSRIAQTVKNIATLTYTLSVPLLDNDLCNKVRAIMNETTSGNVDFSISVVYTSNTYPLTASMKLINAQIITAPNQAPSLNLSFMR